MLMYFDGERWLYGPIQKEREMGKKLVWCLALLIGGISMTTAKADILDIRGVGLDADTTALLTEVEDFFQKNIANDFSDRIPRFMKWQLQKIRVVASLDPNGDGPGGVLASARSTDWIEYHTRFDDMAIVQAGELFIDADTLIDPTLSRNDLFWIITHEVLHAAGFNPGIWLRNDLLVDSRFGESHYAGINAVEAYRRESRLRGARTVPLETAGGGGTAGAHWASFTPGLHGNGRQDVMIGFFDPSNTLFLSNTTIGAMRDVHLTMTDDGFQGGRTVGPRGWKRPPMPFTSVPEPSSACLLVLGIAGMALRRRRA